MLSKLAAFGGFGAVCTEGSVRGLTVLAWGRNLESQCGIESNLLVARPTPVIELHDLPLAGLYAGKLTSGATCRGGEAWTWGEGKAGKLGHGSTDTPSCPHRVESLVGRARIQDMALGDQHTLFVDSSGHIWSCGENKEGQCGFGTPLSVIASQHRRTYNETLRAPLHDHLMRTEETRTYEQRVRNTINTILGTAQQQAMQAAGGIGSMSVGQQGSSGSRSAVWGGSWQGSTGSAGPSSAGARMALTFGGFDAEGAMAAGGLQPGQHTTPLRIGRDQHPLMDVVGHQHHHAGGPAAARAAARAAAGPGSEPRQDRRQQAQSQQQSTLEMGTDALSRTLLGSGLEAQRVVGVAASRHFSIAVTSAGQVWTFGACYNGALGNSTSWSPSAQKVCGQLAEAIEAAGGATQVAAGGTFCAALTASGRVLLWGKVPGSEFTDTQAQMFSLTDQGVSVTRGARLLAGEVPGLPRILHMAAGQQHLALSDGSRVWVIGRMLGAGGTSVPDMCAPWTSPREVLVLPDTDHVKQLTAGAHSCGVVTARGELWLWGRLLDRHHGEGLYRRFSHLTSHEGLLPEDVQWQWAGFGADRPTRVEGLGSHVRSAALGGYHALVAID